MILIRLFIALADKWRHSGRAEIEDDTVSLDQVPFVSAPMKKKKTHDFYFFFFNKAYTAALVDAQF